MICNYILSFGRTQIFNLVGVLPLIHKRPSSDPQNDDPNSPSFSPMSKIGSSINYSTANGPLSLHLSLSLMFVQVINRNATTSHPPVQSYTEQWASILSIPLFLRNKFRWQEFDPQPPYYVYKPAQLYTEPSTHYFLLRRLVQPLLVRNFSSVVEVKSTVWL